MGLQSVVRRITDKGSAVVKLDGPYGGSSSIVHGDCKVAVIFAGGIGVSCTVPLTFYISLCIQCICLTAVLLHGHRLPGKDSGNENHTSNHGPALICGANLRNKPELG